MSHDESRVPAMPIINRMDRRKDLYYAAQAELSTLDKNMRYEDYVAMVQKLQAIMMANKPREDAPGLSGDPFDTESGVPGSVGSDGSCVTKTVDDALESALLARYAI